MKKILGLALAGALSVAALPAVAADYPMKAPPPPIWTWTGFYVGVFGGFGWATNQWWDGANTTGQFQGEGGLVGGTLGWNWQNGPWVVGIEGDIAWTDIHTQVLTAAAFVCAGGSCNEKLNWLGTVRGRLGHANGPLLFFISGGAAFGGFNAWDQAQAFNVTYTDTGWVVGGGFEGNLGGGWSLKAEYLYVAFGDSGIFCAAPACGAPGVHHSAFTANILRGGVNFHF